MRARRVRARLQTAHGAAPERLRMTPGMADAKRNNGMRSNAARNGARSFHGGFASRNEARGAIGVQPGARAGADAAGPWPSQRGLHRMDERLRRAPPPTAGASARRQAVVRRGWINFACSTPGIACQPGAIVSLLKKPS